MRAGGLCIAAAILGANPVWAGPHAGPDEALIVEQAMAVAEASLRAGQPQAAADHYRSALRTGWMLMGGLELVEGRPGPARDAFQRASDAGPAAYRPALQSLALAQLQLGQAQPAIEILTRLAADRPADVALQRLLAQALVAAGRPAQAIERLELARASAPDDLELAYALASGYLQVKRLDEAKALFGWIVGVRPSAAVQLVVGRAYADASLFALARAHLQNALRLDPRLRRAHYTLGLVALGEGLGQLDQAVAEFREELVVAPGDPLANLQLGMALVESRRPAEALAPLELVVRAQPEQARALYFLGRCWLGLERPADALRELSRALELAQAASASEGQLGSLHNQLGLALRKLGAPQAAAMHFAEAERRSARGAELAREELARYQADEPQGGLATTAAAVLVGDSPLARLTPAARTEIRRRVTSALARGCLNLGVLETQAERAAQAAELFAQAAALDPELPLVQRALGLARFNAGQFELALAPLTRALEAAPGDAGVKRLLALACLNTRAYGRAAELLRDDPERGTDPSLQFAYGLALVNDGRGREAEAVFARLLSEHGDSAELNVVLGRAYAQEGDFAKAIDVLTRALRQDPDVAEAHATLGVIYLKQGKLEQAEAALRAELKSRPDDVPSRQNLAMVLDLTGRPEEALPLLLALVARAPELADVRYLLGKLLLAQGAASEAVEQLEAARRLAPGDANVRYQLGRAYQKLGRGELAEREFEVLRQLKAGR